MFCRSGTSGRDESLRRQHDNSPRSPPIGRAGGTSRKQRLRTAHRRGREKSDSCRTRPKVWRLGRVRVRPCTAASMPACQPCRPGPGRDDPGNRPQAAMRHLITPVGNSILDRSRFDGTRWSTVPATCRPSDDEQQTELHLCRATA